MLADPNGEILGEIIARTEAAEDRDNPMFPAGGTDEIDRTIEAREYQLGGQSVREMERALREADPFGGWNE